MKSKSKISFDYRAKRFKISDSSNAERTGAVGWLVWCQKETAVGVLRECSSGRGESPKFPKTEKGPMLYATALNFPKNKKEFYL